MTEVIGTSPTSWEEAAKNGVETAAKTLRDLRVGEVVKLDVTIEEKDLVPHSRTRQNPHPLDLGGTKRRPASAWVREALGVFPYEGIEARGGVVALGRS